MATRPARLQKIARNQPQDEREGRKEQKIGEGFGGNAPYGAEITHASDSGDNRQKYDRGNDHFDESDETFSERSQRLARFRGKLSDDRTQRDGDQNLHVGLRVPFFAAAPITAPITTALVGAPGNRCRPITIQVFVVLSHQAFPPWNW